MRRAHAQPARRRAFIAVAMVLLLGALSLMTLGALDAAGDDADLAALRVETRRAFYAAESGAIVAMIEMAAGRDGPPVGEAVDVDDDQQFTLMQIPPAGDAGEVLVEGGSGYAVRRIVMYVE